MSDHQDGGDRRLKGRADGIGAPRVVAPTWEHSRSPPESSWVEFRPRAHLIATYWLTDEEAQEHWGHRPW